MSSDLGVTNAQRVELACMVEQSVRFVDRLSFTLPSVLEQHVRFVHSLPILTCVEHGFRLSRCAALGLYHANGKVRHGCIKGDPI